MTLRVESAHRDPMRRMNEAGVFGIVHDHNPITRTDIAGLSGHSPATISNSSGTLIDPSVVLEERAGRARQRVLRGHPALGHLGFRRLARCQPARLDPRHNVLLATRSYPPRPESSLQHV